MRVKCSWVVCAALLVCVAGPLAPALAAPAPGHVEEQREQAILYFRRGMDQRARVILEELWQSPEGRADFKTAYYRAQIAYKLLLLEDAFEASAVARNLAREKEELERAGRLDQELTSQYGSVSIVPADGVRAAQGRISFEARTGIINQEKKKVFLSIRERYRSSHTRIPTTVYLPYGEYVANGVAFSVKQGELSPDVPIMLEEVAEVPAAAPSASGQTWLWVGLGTAAIVAAGVGTWLLLREGDAPPPESRFAIEF